MKKLLFGLMAFVIIAQFFSCKNSGETMDLTQQTELEEIAPFLETNVMIYDTMKLKNFYEESLPRNYMEERGGRFLTYVGFNMLMKQLKKTLNDPNALIYNSPISYSVMSIKKRREMIINCDTVE